MRCQTVQWTGENANEIERLLGNHQARADKEGDKLRLIGLGLHVDLNLGDSVMLDGDRLGIVRKEAGASDQFVTWTGSNVAAFEDFLKPTGVWLAVTGESLCVYGGNELIASLSRGDRIAKSGGHMTVSRAGKDHRV